MAGHRSGRWQRGVTLVPLALVSAAWTASVVSAPAVSTVAAGTDEAPAVALPDGTSVPAQAIDAPASVSTGALAAGIGDKNPTQVVATSSTSGIPAAALAASISTAVKDALLSTPTPSAARAAAKPRLIASLLPALQSRQLSSISAHSRPHAHRH